MRQIFSLKGSSGSNWTVSSKSSLPTPGFVDIMMVEERGYSVAREKPLRAAGATFVAFVVVGFIPLFAFILSRVLDQPFVWSSVLTGIAFFVVGALKSRLVAQRWRLSGSETLGMGGAAVAITYAIGAASRERGRSLVLA